MTAQGEKSGLDEFETGSAIGLAPFEEGAGILLDELSEASPGVLEEIDFSIEPFRLSEMLGKIPGENGIEEEGEPSPTEEPGAPEGAVQGPGDETAAIETAVEDEIREEEPPHEAEPEEREPKRVPEPANPVIGFVCEHALDVGGLVDARGMMIQSTKVHLISVPCAGMVKPSWLRHALDNGASGAFVVSCTPGSCRHRTGASVTVARWEGKARPMLLSRCDRRRLKLFLDHKANRKEILREIGEFVKEIGKLDAAGEEPQEKPIESIDIDGL